ncbi:MAG: F0F1 ATP synthase subunit beta, partial [Marinoscillum sp.]
MANKGKITQVIGPVVDVSFEAEGSKLPSIMDALKITKQDGSTVILEVQQHLGEDTVRTIAMDATDGMMRGMEVE